MNFKLFKMSLLFYCSTDDSTCYKTVNEINNIIKLLENDSEISYQTQLIRKLSYDNKLNAGFFSKIYFYYPVLPSLCHFELIQYIKNIHKKCRYKNHKNHHFCNNTHSNNSSYCWYHKQKILIV